MADHQINGQAWPPGTTVTVYPAAAQPAGAEGAPAGASVTSAVVSGASVLFTGLIVGRRYVAYAAGKSIGFLVQPGSVDTMRPISGAEAQVLRDENAANAAGLLTVESDVAVIKEAGLNPHDYGAIGDGASPTADTAGWQAAIAALPTLSGRKTGRLWVPPNKRYKINSLLNVDDTSGVVVECPGGGVSADGGRPMLEWIGAAGSGPMIRAASSYGLHLRNLSLVYSDTAYNGDLVMFGHSASAVDCFYPIIERCLVGGIGSAVLARSAVNINRAICGTFRENQVDKSTAGLRGVDGQYAIAWDVSQNTWNRCSLASIYNVGEGWHIHGGNAFEPRSDDSPSGIINDPAAAVALGVVIEGNWFGDVDTAGGAAGAWIDLRGRGIVIQGNRLHIEQTGSSHDCIILRNVLGCLIAGNNFSSGGTHRAINFQAHSAALCDGVMVTANRFTSITQIANEANLTSGEYRANVGLADKRVPGSASVASAATIAVPAGVDLVNVTGTTNITSVTAGPVGQRVTLVFAGILTFTDGSNLKLAGNFVTTADDAITLVSDGTNWIETGRSVN